MDIKETYLVEQLRKGDTSSLEIVMELYGTRLLRTIYLIVKDEKLAEDILQEVFITLYYKVNQFREESSLYTWLYKIAIHLCRKKIKKYWFKDIIFLDTLFGIKDDCNDFQQSLIDKVYIKELFLNLPDTYRDVMILFYYEDLPIETISKITGEKIGTIKSKLNRGRQNLKKYLEKEF